MIRLLAELTSPAVRVSVTFDIIAEEVDAALAEEREACAQIAEGFRAPSDGTFVGPAVRMAADIIARRIRNHAPTPITEDSSSTVQGNG